MSNEIKKDDAKVPAQQPKQPLPATQEIEEVAETDLDGVAGGWCVLTCGGSCGKTASSLT